MLILKSQFVCYSNLDFPPSTFIIWPVIHDDSVNIYWARLEISSGWPILGIGWVEAIRSTLSFVLSKCSLSRDSIIEGAIILNKILYLIYSAQLDYGDYHKDDRKKYF